MNILVVGSTGFIGRHVVRALIARGHTVLSLGRSELDLAAPVPHIVLPRDVAAVVNLAGVFRERRGASFDAVHARGPIALFDACAAAGVARVVQVSALGADARADTAFLRSKRAADEHLLALPLDATVVQPSLVYGADGASAAASRALASLPVVPLPAGGTQCVQPVHVQDVADAICRLLEAPAGTWRSRRVALVGPQPLALRDYLMALRAGMGLGPARTLAIPGVVMRIAAALADAVRSSLFGRDAWRMLQWGSHADTRDIAALLNRAPRAAADFIAPELARPLRIEAQVAWLLPLLRASLAVLWIWTGIVSLGLYPVADSLALLQQTGVPAAWRMPALLGAAALDLAFGVLTVWPLHARWRRRLWAAQALLIAVYTLIITLRLPAFWLHPFGPLVKNVPILALLALLWVLDRPPRGGQ